MKLYFMKKEALDILKSNLDMVYNMYFIEKDNKWLWKVCGGDPFAEFKEIQDFQLAPIDSDLTKGEVEFANCKIIYQHLSFMNILEKDGIMVQNYRKIRKILYQI